MKLTIKMRDLENQPTLMPAQQADVTLALDEDEGSNSDVEAEQELNTVEDRLAARVA